MYIYIYSHLINYTTINREYVFRDSIALRKALTIYFLVIADNHIYTYITFTLN